MNGPFVAHVIEDHADWMRNTVRLLVVQRRGDGRSELLMGNGDWQTFADEIVPPEPPGLLLPRGAMESILAAIESWQGASSHSATEAKVLREWLTAERARVDALLSKGSA